MLPLVGNTMVRWITAMMANGHSADAQDGRGARGGGAGREDGVYPVEQTAMRGFNCRHERTLYGPKNQAGQ